MVTVRGEQAAQSLVLPGIGFAAGKPLAEDAVRVAAVFLADGLRVPRSLL